MSKGQQTVTGYGGPGGFVPSPRRAEREEVMPRYLAVPVEKRPPGDRPAPWRCTCPERKHYNRHTEPWQCRKEFTTPQRVLAWLKECYETPSR